MENYLPSIWQAAQTLVVVVMIGLLVKVHRQLALMRSARTEAQKWLTEFVEVTNRTKHAFDTLSTRFSQLEYSMRDMEARPVAIDAAGPGRDPDKPASQASAGERVKTVLTAIDGKRAAERDGGMEPSKGSKSVAENILSRLK